jgi:hypothetical protein
LVAGIAAPPTIGFSWAKAGTAAKAKTEAARSVFMKVLLERCCPAGLTGNA